ncbi:TPA: hypothetical protein RVR73_003056 [Aeromonas hydrophila]|nr:hypothetical protein [Aeromonas hydrophila]
MKKILFLLSLLSLSCQGAIVITGVDLQPGGGGYLPKAYFVSNGLPSYDPTFRPYLWANGWNSFGPGLRIVGRTDGQPYTGDLENNISMLGWRNVVNGEFYDTWDTLFQKFIDKFGSSGALTALNGVTNYYKYEMCMAVATCSDCGTAGPNNVRVYPGSCTTVQFVPSSCQFEGNVPFEIDHHELLVEEVNGNVASGTAKITCDLPTNIRLRVSNPKIDLGHGIYSNIFINGKGFNDIFVNNDFSVPSGSGGLQLTIESRLEASNPQPGPFSGDTIVIMDIL